MASRFEKDDGSVGVGTVVLVGALALVVAGGKWAHDKGALDFNQTDPTTGKKELVHWDPSKISDAIDKATGTTTASSVDARPLASAQEVGQVQAVLKLGQTSCPVNPAEEGYRFYLGPDEKSPMVCLEIGQTIVKSSDGETGLLIPLTSQPLPGTLRADMPKTTATWSAEDCTNLRTKEEQYANYVISGISTAPKDHQIPVYLTMGGPSPCNSILPGGPGSPH